MRDDWIPSPDDLGPDPEPPGLRAEAAGDSAAPHTLLVGFDGSPASQRAVRWAARAGGRVLVTVVWVPGTRASLDDPEPDLERVAWRPLIVSAIDVAGGLLHAARRHAAAAIVVGADDPALGGDVAARLTAASDLPVVVIPAPPVP